jgi:prolyl oligopeptidase family protein
MFGDYLRHPREGSPMTNKSRSFLLFLIVWPEEDHWILKGENSRYWCQEVYAWLKKYLDRPQKGT